MRIANTGNLPHPHSKKNNKPWETFRPHKGNLHLIGTTQFPICYAFCVITERSLALSLLSLEAFVGSSKVPPFPLSLKAKQMQFADHPQMSPASTLSSWWPCLDSVFCWGGQHQGPSHKLRSHLTNAKHGVPSFTLTNAAQLFVKY